MAVDIPHGLEGYRRYKCDCVVCKKAQAKFMREYRAAAKAKKLAEAADNVHPLRRRGRPMNTVVGGDVLNGRAKPDQKQPDEQPGDMERAVISVAANSPIADERQDIVVQARILARVMDNSLMQKDHGPTSRQLNNLMTQLCPVAKTKSGGRLHAIRKMTNRVTGDGSTQSG